MTRHLARAALLVFVALWLASCELVIGGENHAILRSQDGAADDADPDSTADAATSD